MNFESSNASAQTSSADKSASRRPFLNAVKQDLLMVLVFATASACGGLAINQLRDQPLPLVYASKQTRLQRAVSQLAGGSSDSQPAASQASSAAVVASGDSSPQVIDLARFRAFVEGKQGLVLDARPEIFHRLGHVPGALSVSREEFELDYASHRSLLEVKREKPIAVYCSSASCQDSQMVADALTKLGYGHVMVFKGGWDEWTRADLPQEKENK